jgi:DNA-directed RNA polymerase subunit H
MDFKVTDHILVPKHEKLDEEEAEKLLQKYNITKLQLPKISKKDPVLKDMSDIKVGNIIRITRNSGTAGKSFFYRVVINE